MILRISKNFYGFHRTSVQVGFNAIPHIWYGFIRFFTMYVHSKITAIYKKTLKKCAKFQTCSKDFFFFVPHIAKVLGQPWCWFFFSFSHIFAIMRVSFSLISMHFCWISKWFLMDFNRISFGFQQDFIRISIGFQYDFNRISIGFLWVPKDY